MKNNGNLLGILSALGMVLGLTYLGNEVYSIKKKKDFIWNHPEEFEKSVTRKSK